MKVIIMSDNHSDVAVIEKIKQKYPDITHLVHCGDYCSSKQDDALIRVKGNCDYENIEEEKIVEIDGLRFLVVHGHLFSKLHLIEDLFALAKYHACDVVCFGHIHRRVLEKRAGIILINPGSLSYNYDFTNPGYALFDTKSKEVEFVELDRRF